MTKYNANTNIAEVQGGDELMLGAQTPNKSVYTYEDLRAAWGIGNPAFVGFVDDFLGDTVKDELAVDISTSSTVAINAQPNGVIRMTTHTDDNANCTVALGLHYTVADAGPIIFRARVASITALTTRSIEIGLNDALTETSGQAFSSHDATPVAVATNAAMFGMDTDGSMTSYAAVSVNAGGTPQDDQDLRDLVAGTFDELMIIVDAAGNAWFFTLASGVATQVAYHALAVATTAVLTPWISLTNLAGGAAIADADYLSISGARG